MNISSHVTCTGLQKSVRCPRTIFGLLCSVSYSLWCKNVTVLDRSLTWEGISESSWEGVDVLTFAVLYHRRSSGGFAAGCHRWRSQRALPKHVVSAMVRDCGWKAGCLLGQLQLLIKEERCYVREILVI